MKFIIFSLLGIFLNINLVQATKAPTTLDMFLGEHYEGASKQTEDALIKVLGDLSLKHLKRRHPTGHIPRDVHAKSHGCLFGTMKVDNSKLPKALRVGVFKENNESKVVLRYSSNDKDRNLSDMRQDIRGLGLKVMNVNGEQGLTQDFLFLASETFFIKDNAFYVDFLKLLFTNSFKAKAWLLMNDFKGALSIGYDMARTTIKYTNPLEIPFFSAVSYRLGRRFFTDGSVNRKRRAVKYRISRVSCDGTDIEDPSLLTRFNKNFLRRNLKRVISSGEACLKLSVQVRSNKDRFKYPVEDSSVSWKGVPYTDVAIINIHQQEFDSEQMNNYCENLKFSPWTTLPEHHPLGRINRARKEIYQRISDHRHKQNGVDNYKEPVDFSMVIE